MSTIVTKISAIGTRGMAKGVIFTAQPNSSGQYVLNRKILTTPVSENTTNKAASKHYVSDLTEAASLLSTNDYLINLVSSEGKRALREFRKVKIEHIGDIVRK